MSVACRRCLQRAFGARRVINAKRNAVAVAEIKLRKGAVQVPFPCGADTRPSFRAIECGANAATDFELQVFALGVWFAALSASAFALRSLSRPGIVYT
jgi:hypothetical protein